MQQLRGRLQQVVASSPGADRLIALLQRAWLLGPQGYRAKPPAGELPGQRTGVICSGPSHARATQPLAVFWMQRGS